MSTKITTLRLDTEVAAELALVARVDGTSISNVVRDAIAQRIAERRADPHFQERLKGQIEEDQKLMERLARWTGD